MEKCLTFYETQTGDRLKDLLHVFTLELHPDFPSPREYSDTMCETPNQKKTFLSACIAYCDFLSDVRYNPKITLIINVCSYFPFA